MAKITTDDQLTLEEQYQKELKILSDRYPAKSPEREEAKQALWDEFQAARFIRDGRSGDVRVIHRIQRQLATAYYNVLDEFYSGAFREEEFSARMNVALRTYCEQMVELGLASGVPGDDWLTPFSEAYLALSLSLLPAKTSGFTKEDADLLCKPCRTEGVGFLLAFHSQFGLGELRKNPEVLGGVVLEAKDENIRSL